MPKYIEIILYKCKRRHLHQGWKAMDACNDGTLEYNILDIKIEESK